MTGAHRTLAKRTGIAANVLLLALSLAAAYLLPTYPLFVFSLAVVNIIAVLGVNLVMGYAGQISLGHAGFAAIGAYATALLVGSYDLSFWLALALGGFLAAGFGYLLGVPALRLGPLYVSMVTFGFGLVVVIILQNWYELANGPNGMVVPPPELFGYELFPRQFHVPIVLIAAGLFLLARNIVDSRHGRAFIAIRENELAARGMGINIAHYKTIAFAVGAFYAGISGGLFAGLAQFVNPDAFVFPVSILYVTMGILGGIGSLAGAALGGLMLTVLPELLRGAAEYKDFLTGLLLLVLLIFLPKGVVGVLQKSFGSLLRARAGATLSAVSVELPGGLRGQVGGTDLTANPPCEEPRATAASDPLLKVEGVGISFGGLRALQDISLQLGANEILGVIGPNGAGKTTLFNVISGMAMPDQGRIMFAGQNIIRMPAHARTRLGMARTFQNLALFSDMSVIDNVRVGAHVRLNSRLLSAGLRIRSERVEELRSLGDAAGLLDFVGLLPYAEQPAHGLAFGHQRLLEVARALASRPRLLLLDEPAAGLNSAELESLVLLIRRIRETYALSVLLIGHTMRLVMGLSDRIIVLDHGVQLAEGSPREIQSDARVIAAYLGAEDAA
ncbi:MAG TPA: branched-chain amino acid ABC transporter ATP-binding protein/permease [Xanthobacteraceae bacterium]|jgi:branched-chain amino acid transport system permease protein